MVRFDKKTMERLKRSGKKLRGKNLKFITWDYESEMQNIKTKNTVYTALEVLDQKIIYRNIF